MDATYPELIAIALTFILAGIVKGVTGMGLPTVAMGERLCRVLELFREIVPHARLSLEQLILLVFTLSEGDQWSVERCSSCRAIILVDRSSLAPRLCSHCPEEPITESTPVPPRADRDALVSGGIQQSLF